jgi:hypothetical protein
MNVFTDADVDGRHLPLCERDHFVPQMIFPADRGHRGLVFLSDKLWQVKAGEDAPMQAKRVAVLVLCPDYGDHVWPAAALYLIRRINPMALLFLVIAVAVVVLGIAFAGMYSLNKVADKVER